MVNVYLNALASLKRTTLVTQAIRPARNAVRPSLGRLASSSAKATPANSPIWRGVLAGLGFSIAGGLFAYRAGVISLSDGGKESKVENAYGSEADVQRAIADLRIAFPDAKAVSTDPNALKNYGSSPNSYHPASPHSVVVHVHSTEDVVKVVNIARKYHIPIVAYSGATSLEGHFSGVGDYLSPG